MDSKYELRLNFLPLKGKPPHFYIFRSVRNDGSSKPSENVFGFSLPLERNGDERQQYWVQFAQADGFEEYIVDAYDNIHLTRRALFEGLCAAANAELQPSKFEIPKGGFFEEIRFNFEEHEEGYEQLTIQPYFLKEKQSFGWIADFHFRVREGVPFSRRVQQLSLSLDKNFKRNLDCYLDRFNRINSYLHERRGIVDSVCLPGGTETIQTADNFALLQARRLRSKIYLFSENKSSRSQFTGLRQYGPLEPLAEAPHLLFAFRECDRQAARTLAMALQGSKHRERFSFPGFKSLFKSPLTIDANPIVLPDLSLRTFQDVLGRVKTDKKANPSVVPVFVLPEGDDNGYMEHKAIFTHEGIPTQVCTLKIISDSYALKWAIANIALQIFCKAGGKPWKVRPTSERTLIIGISQSHKIRKVEQSSRVEKYFAFSVMGDNSGLFQQLRVLGDSDNESTYLQEIRTNLKEILRNRSTEFSRVVIHSSFRLKRNEMKVIEDTVRDAQVKNSVNGCRFAVVKVNHHNRFFGANPDVNSLVPFEGTVVRLGGREYLIWFEGIFPDKQTVTQAFRGPTHVNFLRVSDEDAIADEALLQDLVNLSGANWRGFNAKSAPVSVFYCHLVADLVHDFQERGLPLPQIHDLRPWFL